MINVVSLSPLSLQFLNVKMNGSARRLVVIAGFILTFAVLHMFATVGLLHSQIIEGVLRGTGASPTESPTTSPTVSPTASPTLSPTASPTVLSPTPSKKETSCALLFFGLVKHFEIVLPSIQEYILQSNKDCDIYAHTYNIEKTTNPRNNERDEKITPGDVYQLTERVVMDSDDDFHAAHDVEYYRSYFPPKKRGWQFPESMDNMIKQWHSIARVWELMESNELTLRVTYSRVGLFRLDVQYQNSVYINDGDAVEPKGMNDRLFYGTRSNAEVWATGRFNHVQTYLTTRNHLWSEGFMKWLMRDIAVEPRSICFYRVRANGKISTNDCKLPKTASSTTSPTSNVVEDDEQDLV